MPNGPAAYVGLEIGARAGRAHAGQRLRVRRRGDRLRARPAPARPGRRRRRRRHRGVHPPADHRRIRADAGDEHAQRRARARVAPVRQGPRRLRARRGRRRPRAGARARRPQARGRTPYAVLAGAGVTADSHDIVAARPGRLRSGPCGTARHRAGRARLSRRRARQRARHLDARGRHRRGALDRRQCSASRPSSPQPSR